MSIHINESGTIKDISVKLTGFTINGVELIYENSAASIPSSGATGSNNIGLGIETPHPLVYYRSIIICTSNAEANSTISVSNSLNIIQYFKPNQALKLMPLANKSIIIYLYGCCAHTNSRPGLAIKIQQGNAAIDELNVFGSIMALQVLLLHILLYMEFTNKL